MNLKKVIRQIHLWLGIISGLPVMIVALTGCIYAFQEEIQNATQSFRFVEERNQAFLLPSRLQNIAGQELPGKKAHAVMYKSKKHAAIVIFYSLEENYYDFVYLNPYTGEVLKVWDEQHNFFRFILNGHFYLWMKPEIGQPLVASLTLIFVVLICSGLFLWWPRNANNRLQRFSIKWNARWRRLNFDLHSVMGFYVFLFALIFSISGLVWGFEWFRNMYYSAVNGGESFVEYYEPESSSNAGTISSAEAVDRVYLLMQSEHPEAEWIEVHIPETALSPVVANSNPDQSTYWKTDYRYFDQYSLKELQVNHIWGRKKDAGAGELLFRMNYDIHVGSILGLPGKVLAFLLSLVIASLPLTGFLMWWGRRQK